MIVDAGGFRGEDARENTEMFPIRTKQFEEPVEAADELAFTLSNRQSTTRTEEAQPVRDPATRKAHTVMLQVPWPFLSPLIKLHFSPPSSVSDWSPGLKIPRS